MEKSTVDEIRTRFDSEVERFSNLQTGQSATMDAPLAMELIGAAAAAITPAARSVLDVGCGAGNYTLKLLEKLGGVDVTLIDLSRPMLDRASQRCRAAGARSVTAIQSDIRAVNLAPGSHDIILASAVLHHLRTDEEWQAVFKAFHRVLRPGGSIWIFDLVEQATPQIQAFMWQRYGDYLTNLKNEAYRDEVFNYIANEDTPRSLTYQLSLLENAGFSKVEILHKNGPFAAFGGVK